MKRAVANEVCWELLSDQQKKFSEEWVRTHNYPKALTAGGYSFELKHSGSLGHRLVKRCSRYIKYLEAHALRSAHISIEAIQHQYVRLGFANPLNYYIRDKSGRRKRPKTIDELTHDEAAAIKEWDWLPWKNEDGTETLVMGSIKLHDQVGPLRDLGKTLGAFPTKFGEQPPGTGAGVGSGIDFSRLPPDELRQLDVLFKKAISRMSAARDAQAITVPGAAAEPTREPVKSALDKTLLLPSGSKDSQ
jgi:hypothetical protein